MFPRVNEYHHAVKDEVEGWDEVEIVNGPRTIFYHYTPHPVNEEKLHKRRG